MYLILNMCPHYKTNSLL